MIVMEASKIEKKVKKTECLAKWNIPSLGVVSDAITPCFELGWLNEGLSEAKLILNPIY